MSSRKGRVSHLLRGVCCSRRRKTMARKCSDSSPAPAESIRTRLAAARIADSWAGVPAAGMAHRLRLALTQWELRDAARHRVSARNICVSDPTALLAAVQWAQLTHRSAQDARLHAPELC